MGRSAEIAIPCLVDLILDDSQPAVRDAAAVALPLTGPQATRAVRFLLDDSDPEVRWRAADAVPHLLQDRLSCQARLTQMLQDPQPDIRLHAAESLWRITGRGEPVVGTLLAGLQDSDRQLRIRALRILVDMSPSHPQVAEHLRMLLKHSNPKVRQAAVSGLRRLKLNP